MICEPGDAMTILTGEADPWRPRQLMKDSPEALEVEVKFHIHQPDSMLQTLVDMAEVAQPRTFETNLCFEDREHHLKANHQLLRLRQDKICRLTFKSKPPQRDSQCKIYREFEVEISDFKTMRAILTELGYHTAQIYEKWRQIFRWRDVELCLDTMPFGTFLEIEGPPESIRLAARQIGLPWKNRILENYLAMFEDLRKQHHLPFKDVTFSNFKTYPMEKFTARLKIFEAGG
jgi:adenylate cyclase class 2